MTAPLAVFTTLDDAEAAAELARRAVSDGLAACVQREEIDSIYTWQGAVQTDREIRLLFKTTEAAYDALAALILSAHPYDEPALWAYRIERGSPGYLDWIEANARPRP